MGKEVYSCNGGLDSGEVPSSSKFADQTENRAVDRGEEVQLKNEIHYLLEQEESKWKEKAKENWLRHED